MEDDDSVSFIKSIRGNCDLNSTDRLNYLRIYMSKT